MIEIIVGLSYIYDFFPLFLHFMSVEPWWICNMKIISDHAETMLPEMKQLSIDSICNGNIIFASVDVFKVITGGKLTRLWFEIWIFERTSHENRFSIFSTLVSVWSISASFETMERDFSLVLSVVRNKCLKSLVMTSELSQWSLKIV